MIKIKRLSECTIEEATKAWNDGFEGYFFDATMNEESFINRLVLEGLSPKLSVVAFKDDQPIGLILNGVRLINGKKFAWNGGTGVAAAFRKQGVGKALMEATFSIYNEEGVNIASLEAISENSKAISLYESLGYKTVDELEHLELKGSLSYPISNSFEKYKIEKIATAQINNLPFYKNMNPWQTHWKNAKDSEAVFALDSNGEEIGYAYYRKTFDENGKHTGTVLFQCEAKPDREDAKEIVKFLLEQIFASFTDDIRRLIPNIPVQKSGLTYSILTELGFTNIVKLVYMLKEM